VTAGRARTVFVGSGRFGLESLRRLRDHDDVDLVGVVTAPPRPAGRGGRLARSAIHEAADGFAVDVILTPGRLRAPESIADVLALEPDLLVLADYGQIVPSALLDVRHAALNLHPSLLPRHRGATPIPAAILAGDGETGVTLLQMDSGLDTGPIIAHATRRLDGSETTPSLEADLEVMAADLLAQNIGAWIRGELTARPQPTAGATLTRPLRRDDGRLDPGRSAVDLERQVRAYQPWPGSFVDSPAGRIIVWAATPDADPSAARPGILDTRGLGVGRDERLVFEQVQPAGGTRMSWAAFTRGRPSIIGASIVG
jgi:methionyl-tRNA formyltransferase